MGLLFSIKLLLVGIKWAQKIFITLIPVLLIFTQGPSKEELLTKSIPEQFYYNLVGTMRQDSRLILGRIIPLKPTYFKNLNEEDVIMLPKAEDALIQLNTRTNTSIERLSQSVPAVQKQIKLMAISVWKLFTEEDSPKRNIASHH